MGDESNVRIVTAPEPAQKVIEKVEDLHGLDAEEFEKQQQLMIKRNAERLHTLRTLKRKTQAEEKERETKWNKMMHESDEQKEADTQAREKELE